jgi:hypothetical protein
LEELGGAPQPHTYILDPTDRVECAAKMQDEH